ncbi:MAG: carbohydrate ABC transporter permease [Candidatus Bathyarchaeia archaeon]
MDVLRYLLIALILVIVLFPVYWILITSIKPENQITIYPPVFLPFSLTLEHYIHVIYGYSGLVKFSLFPSYFMNSIIVSSASTVLSILLALFAAFSFSRYRFRGKDILFLSIIILRACPGIALSIPLYIFFRSLRLDDTLLGLFIAYTALNTPFATWLLFGYLDEIPRVIDEAARIDGASWWSVLWNILVPLSKPGILTTALLIFIFSWNEFPIAFVVTSSVASRTATVGIYTFMQEFFIDWGGMSAAATLMYIPPMILAFIAQKALVRGLTFGAIKG